MQFKWPAIYFKRAAKFNGVWMSILLDCVRILVQLIKIAFNVALISVPPKVVKFLQF